MAKGYMKMIGNLWLFNKTSSGILYMFEGTNNDTFIQKTLMPIV